MGRECTKSLVKEDRTEIPLIPPGFKSLTSFTLKKAHGSMTISHCTSNLQMINEEHSMISDEVKLSRILKHKPWINYSQFDNSSGEESDSEEFSQDNPHMRSLPKGVIHGCSDCRNCQKVTAVWRPEGACRPVLDDAPVFYPSEEEFKDPLKYIASIRCRAEAYGICRIIPPYSWKPPCLLKEKSTWEKSTFDTRIQRIDKLQNRVPMQRSSRYYKNMTRKRKKRLRTSLQYSICNTEMAKNALGSHNYAAERFGFEIGSQFTLAAFQKFADDFRKQYFMVKESHFDSQPDGCKLQNRWEPSVENIEGEYWRIVEKPTEQIEVLYGADIETGKFGSGFPKLNSVSDTSDVNYQYMESGWNLNNFSRLPGSLLSFESGDISGVQVPWLYIGMCFSSFCWHVEDHHLYSLNYMHWGAPKIWYGVPGKEALKFEAAMKKHLPDLFEEQPDLLHKLVTQLSPSVLKSEGVPVYRCVQNPREFVLTFPRAYHSGFSCGFNCAEAVNVAPVDWLPHGQSAVELYCTQGRRTSVSHDKLLLGAAREAVRALWELMLLRRNTSDNLRWKGVCGNDGILSKAMKTRVEMERARRESLNISQLRKMDETFDATCERECITCFYDLHISAAGCVCSPDRYSCLSHAKQLCACPWNSKFFLFRYEIRELNTLVEALEGKLSAVHKWAYLDLGLSLSTFVNKDKAQESSSSSGAESTMQAATDHGSSREKDLRIVNDVNKTDYSSICCNADTRKDQHIFNEMNQVEFSPNCSMKPSADDLASEDKMEGETPKENTVHTVGRSETQVPLLETYSGTHGLPICEHSEEDRSYEELPEITSSNLRLYGLSTTSHDDLLLRKIDPVKAAVHLSEYDSVIIVSDDDGESPSEYPEGSLQLGKVDSEVTTENDSNDQGLGLTETSMTVLSQREGSLHVGGTLNPLCMRIVHRDNETLLEDDFTIPKVSMETCLLHSLSRAVKNSSDTTLSLDPLDGSVIQPFPYATEDINKDDNIKNAELHKVDIVEAVVEDSSDRIFSQNGLQMAKMVRRVNSVVELLDIGIVLSEKLWSNCQAIFPKGFRSRVSFLSVIDPAKTCYYINEILDAGLPGPLFMVTMEQCPSEVFIHVCTNKCWDLVRERVNLEIRKQHSLGRIGLPPLQSPGSLSGLEMFGFFSPVIVQAIEAMDPSHLCAEYWSSRDVATYMDISLPKHSSVNPHHFVDKEVDENPVLGPGKSLHGTETIFRGLLKKANLVELQLLHSLLTDARMGLDQELVVRLLVEEFHNRTRQSTLHK